MTERPRAAVTTRLGLRCQHGLQLDLVHHEGLYELGLGQGGLDLEDWLVREDWGAFTDGVDIAREPEVGKPREEPIGEYFERIEVGEVLLRETEIF